MLDGTPGFSAAGACRAIESKAGAWHRDGDLAMVLRETAGDLEVLRRMEALAGEGLTRLSMIGSEAAKPSPDADWIRRIWKDVPAIEREIETMGRTHPALMPPVVLFGFGKEALEGKDLAPMADTAAGLFADLKKHLSMLAETIGLLVEKQVKGPPGSCNT